MTAASDRPLFKTTQRTLSSHVSDDKTLQLKPQHDLFLTLREIMLKHKDGSTL